MTREMDFFSKADFEATLPVDKNTNLPLWQSQGLVKGEYTYTIQVKPGIVIWIRSSVDSTGLSAETGGDSIRLWLMNESNKSALGKETYTQRTIGWQERMTDKIRELYKTGLSIPICPLCNSPMALRKGKYGQFYGCSMFPRCKGTRQLREAQQAPVEKQEEEKEQEDLKQGAFDFLSEESQAVVVDDLPDSGGGDTTPTYQAKTAKTTEKDKGNPNQKQLEAITAPIDGATRVLAPPGSGKTFLMIRRYAHLVENGENPDNILVVTYSKSMADEMLARISDFVELSDCAKAQISTIHAACYRILLKEGDNRQPAKEWQIKKILQEIAEDVWLSAPERPGWKEIIAWIESAKMHGLSSSEDYEYFSKVKDKFGNNMGSKLHQARLLFDQRMKNFVSKKGARPEALLTFADMLFDVEQRLKRDKDFRNKWQARFKHVVVDESQDTSGQALRILITLSFEPGNNPVYGG